MIELDLAVGEKIYFKKEKRPYLITARNNRFIIATKPFNAKKTFFYTIIDLKEMKRSSDNWYCKYEYENPIEAMKTLEELNSGKIKLSSRRIINLDLDLR